MKITALINPLLDWLDPFKESLAQVATTTMETGVSAYEEIRALKLFDGWARDKILTLENKQKERILKLRGTVEKSEEGMKLTAFIGNLLACDWRQMSCHR